MFRLNLITPKHLRIGLTQIFNHIIQDVTISSSPWGETYWRSHKFMTIGVKDQLKVKIT